MQSKHFIYDGTFEGLLSTIFKYFEYKLNSAVISINSNVQDSLFHDTETIFTNEKESQRVWNGLKNIVSKQGLQLIEHAFLSEHINREQLILNFCIETFQNKKTIESDFSNPTVIQLAKLKKQVSRERHRMTAFVRFKLTKDQVYFASIEPDFNVLPLIITHFKNRYTDQQWVIYDVKRKYGIYYDLKKVIYVNFEFDNRLDFTKTNEDLFACEELEFQKLWQHYFKSVNIASRKNLKLHTQHVPKRYWKYLSEKQS